MSRGAPGYTTPDAALLLECEISNCSTHSPGGQHRNKTEASIRLRHRPSGLGAQCDEHRDRADNRIEALRRLRIRLAVQQRGVSDPAWLQPFRSDDKLTIRPMDAGYPLVVACCLDALAANGCGLAEAAQSLGISTGQFTKQITGDNDVLVAANALRAAAGLHPLRRSPGR